MSARLKLGELLIQEGLIDAHQLQSALGHQRQWGGRLGQILVDKRFLSEEAIADAVAKRLGMKRIDLGAMPIDPAALAKIDLKVCEEKHIFPCAIREQGKVLWVAMEDPSDLDALDDVTHRVRMRVSPVVATATQIRDAIARGYPNAKQNRR